MMSNVIQFPDRFPKKPRRYRIPLYSDADIDLVLFCVNAFGISSNRLMIDDLLEMDPVDVMECLDFALESDIVSNEAKRHIRSIWESIEES